VYKETEAKNGAVEIGGIEAMDLDTFSFHPAHHTSSSAIQLQQVCPQISLPSPATRENGMINTTPMKLLGLSYPGN
jgi:hypothetical protein